MCRFLTVRVLANNHWTSEELPITEHIELPYIWLNHVFCNLGGGLFLLSVCFLVWGLIRKRGARKRVLLASLGCFLLFLIAGAANYALIFFVQLPALRPEFANAPGSQTRIGDQAPTFSLATPDGMKIRLPELRGRVVLLNFFATWCGPCQQELPHLQKIWDEMCSNGDFAMVVVGREESAATVAQFKAEHNFTFPMAADPDRSIYAMYAD